MSRAVIRNTVDLVAFSLHEGKIHVLLIRRAKPPFEGQWALPGGHVDEGEDLYTAARRETMEETGMGATANTIAQVVTLGDPGRDPRGHYVSTVFVGVFNKVPVVGADDAAEARWFDVNTLAETELAFDHAVAIKLALLKVHTVFYTTAGHSLMGLALRPEVVAAERVLGA